MGSDWAIKNQTFINLKRRTLSFEDLGMRVVMPIDPPEGQRYVEPLKGEYHEGNLDTIYNIFSMMDDYINPMTNGKLGWRSVRSYSLDLGETLENLQNQLHEVSIRKCTKITKSL